MSLRVTYDEFTLLCAFSNEYGHTWWHAWGPWNMTHGSVGGSEESAIFLASALEALGRCVCVCVFVMCVC